MTLEDYKLVVTLSDGTVLRLEQSLLGATGAKGDTGAQGAQGEKGEKGDTGAAGRGIDRVVLTAEGCLIFEYSDGTKSEPTASLMGAQGAKGDKGDTGADGRGIVTVSLDGGDLYVTYSDSATPVRIGTVQGEKGDKGDPGAQGAQGEKGEKGDTGRGIQKTEIVDGKLIVTYTDVTQEDLGSIAAGDGEIFVYTLQEDGTYSISAGEGAKTATVLTIPSSYQGIAVTSIADSGFINLLQLNEVTIPDTVLTLGDYAFYNCVKLTSISLSAQLETIGSYALANCTSLADVTIPSQVNLIRNYAFWNDNALKSATFENKNGWYTDYSSSMIRDGYIFMYSHASWGSSGTEYEYCPFDSKGDIAKLLSREYFRRYYIGSNSSGQSYGYHYGMLYCYDWHRQL